VDGVARELEIRALGGATLDTVYFGGGTPSKLGGEGVDALLTRIRDRFSIAPDAEVTLEANPEDVSRANADAWREAGVKRLSIGAQSFDERVLAWMHRTHSASATTDAVRHARDAGITNLSLDLIFALPETLDRNLAQDLDRMIELAPDHISSYGLTIEAHTPLGKWHAWGDVDEAPDERWAAEFELTHETLERAGYAHYEVSNFAREGRVAMHNSAYWQDRHYIGIGPSAHGFDGVSRRWNEQAYAHWLEKVRRGEDPAGGSETLTGEQRTAERAYLGLRTRNGLGIGTDEVSFVTPWIDAGWAVLNDRHDSRILSLTPAGWMRLDALAAALTDFRSR
jgi:oxygen-independent coproporphyrinogen-3 oxidase